MRRRRGEVVHLRVEHLPLGQQVALGKLHEYFPLADALLLRPQPVGEAPVGQVHVEGAPNRLEVLGTLHVYRPGQDPEVLDDLLAHLLDVRYVHVVPCKTNQAGGFYRAAITFAVATFVVAGDSLHYLRVRFLRSQLEREDSHEVVLVVVESAQYLVGPGVVVIQPLRDHHDDLVAVVPCGAESSSRLTPRPKFESERKNYRLSLTGFAGLTPVPLQYIEGDFEPQVDVAGERVVVDLKTFAQQSQVLLVCLKPRTGRG